MVSQSQEEWEGGSRGGSMLSLDGRPRPTPPSYYDAVRSRHSLSQPPPKSPEHQDKLQQVKYNSLPRPLPQRCPPSSNGRWGDVGPRQQYDSPPKPANRVPLQLLRPNFPTNGGDNGMLPNRKEALQSLSIRTQPPPMNPRRQQRPPVPNGMDTNSLPRRDSNGLLRRCYPILPNGTAYPPPPHGYEPRYSKSGKLCSRPPPDPRPMPPPVVMLRTGPLGSYPDAEALKKFQPPPPPPQDVSRQIYVDTNSNYGDGEQAIAADHLAIPYRIPQVPPPGKSPVRSRTLPVMTRRPPDPSGARSGSTTDLDGGDAIYANQFFPSGQSSALNCGHQRASNGGSDYDQQRGPLNNGHQKAFNGAHDYDQQRGQPSLNNGHQKAFNGAHEYDQRGQSALSNGHQKAFNGVHDYDQQRSSSGNGHQKAFNGASDYDQQRGLPSLSNGHQKAFNGAHDYVQRSHSSLSNGHQKPFNGVHDFEQRGGPPSISNGHQKSFNGAEDYDQRIQSSMNSSHQKAFNNDFEQRRKSPSNSSHQKPFNDYDRINNANPLYENSPMDSSENLYANHPVYARHPKVPSKSTRRNTHPPPPVAQKPGDMAYSKEVVKPTPRLPNGILSATCSQSVPAYQFVLKELSSQQQLTSAASSSTLSLGSSSSSGREFGRRPTKSDSFAELGRASETNLKPIGSHQQIDKSLLSVSMTSLCSDASSSISLRPRKHLEESWDRMSEETQRQKEKGSIFSASPWEREEKEKLQQEQVLDARRVRDQEIAHLESLAERSEKQSEWLRILRLEKEFQRRAEEDDASSSSSDTDSEDTDKVENFHRDKLTVIPNERMGLQLLDELLDSASRSSPPEHPRNTSPEKHFTPLDVTIPADPPTSLPPTHNILKISSAEDPRKPPVPAPRPSKDDQHHLHHRNVSSLTRLDISDPCAYFCSGEEEDNNWMIEVPNDPSRIYENVDRSHTLPKSPAKRRPVPVMGVSSTLKKCNGGGFVPSDADILPSLYASVKAGNGHAVMREVPSDLVGKSPEFKKMWVQRPEKLTFQDKIRKFSLQAGEEEAPRDRVKNSRAQREIEIKFSDAQKRAQQRAMEG